MFWRLRLVNRRAYDSRMKVLFAALLIATSAVIAPANAQVGREKGEAFLAENAKKEGVKVLPSGLQYKVIKEGTGKTPTKSDTVSVHYKGTLIDGREFDSSYKRGEPAEFGVTQVIKGWTEILQLMKEGAKYQVFIPWQLAYGERGAGDLIGPNETLVFDVELLKVK
jgi:FKBP-type peptidyl-prolyl cis-trans isomerase